MKKNYITPKSRVYTMPNNSTLMKVSPDNGVIIDNNGFVNGGVQGTRKEKRDNYDLWSE